MTEQIMALHVGKPKKLSPSSNRTSKSTNPPSDSFKYFLLNEKLITNVSIGYLFLCYFNFRSRLRVIESDADLLPPQLLRKYIAYARTYVHPQLDEEAKKEIRSGPFN